MTIDEYIDADPADGILGKFRFIDDDICLGVIGENAKLIDYIVEAHLNGVIEHAGVDRFYAVVDIRHVLWANKDFAKLIQDGMFLKTIKSCAILAETDFSRMLGESWLQGDGQGDSLTIVDNLDSALYWVKQKKATHQKKVA